jgi:hypothetical protein
MGDWWNQWLRVREASQVADNLDEVLAAGGLTAPMLAGVLVFAFIGLSVTIGPGIFWGLFAAVVCAPCVMWAFREVREAREKSRQPPDYDRWQKVAVYSIWMAASLWADRVPTPIITPSSKIYPYLQQLKAAVETGILKTIDSGADMKARVRREDLITYATAVGEKPKFLFPEA